MKIEFTVPGEPQGKGRPKFSARGKFVSVRTPDQTVLYENLIVVEYQRQNPCAKFADGVPLKIKVDAYYQIPASKPKKTILAMEPQDIRPVKKPDADNILKVVCDALNGVAYRDDSQIVDAVVHKYYSHDPRIEVVIVNESAVRADLNADFPKLPFDEEPQEGETHDAE